MSRLFLKLFVLLALAVFGSGALVIGIFDYSVFPTENRQLEASVGPGVAALAQRIGEGADPTEVLAQARQGAGDTLAILPLHLVPATDEARARLEAGAPVIGGEGPDRTAWALVPGRDEVVEMALLSYHGSRVQWVGLPATRALGRPATAEEEASLSELDRARLAWRSIALDRSRIAWSDQGAVRVADLPSFVRGRELGMGLTLLGTSLAILFSLLPIRRELLALDQGARRLREGDLSARVEVGPRVGPVGEVSTQVNAMADRVQQLIQSHEELLRSVSHELQTPLARLLFAIDALQESPEPHDELLQGMRGTVDELRVLAEEVLQFHRLGRGQEHLLEREPVDLAELAGDVALAFEGVSVEAPEQGAFVDGDPRLLYRALRNLVENAVVYGTPPVVRVGPDDGGVVVHVDDGGDGVPEAARERIFEAFYRVEGSRARATGGTGLGLAIVRRVAERHGGWASVGDSPEGGARFTVWLPRSPPRSGGTTPA